MFNFKSLFRKGTASVFRQPRFSIGVYFTSFSIIIGAVAAHAGNAGSSIRSLRSATSFSRLSCVIFASYESFVLHFLTLFDSTCKSFKPFMGHLLPENCLYKQRQLACRFQHRLFVIAIMPLLKTQILFMLVIIK